MTVKVRPYKRGSWEIDIMLTIPGHPRIRERRKAPMKAKSAAKRWGEERERQLIQHYTTTPTNEDEADRPDLVSKEIPTLARFIPRYVEGHCKANRLRPSTIAQRLIVYQSHLIPAFGRKRLDRFTAEDIQHFKAERSDLKGSTVNLMLTLLPCILNVAVEWKVIQSMPVRIKMLKEPAQDFLSMTSRSSIAWSSPRSSSTPGDFSSRCSAARQGSDGARSSGYGGRTSTSSERH